jgi:hypothetical protein
MRVLPLSAKAKNRLANVMGNDPEVRVEQRLADKVFVVSSNGKYCTWVNLRSDPHWELVLSA